MEKRIPWVSDFYHGLLYEDNVPWLEVDDPQMMQLMDIGKAGFCMCCGNRLGDDTVVLMGPGGIGGVYDKGVCLTDQLLIGWLQEQLSDTQDKIMHRQQLADGMDQGDVAPMEPEEDPEEGD